MHIIAKTNLSIKVINLVSIIIPCYNVGSYIEQCIDSILSQSYKSLEIIVIDDGSTDNTGEILKHYNDSRLKIIHQKNAGLSAARNTGLKVAKGKYIAFVDGDDFIEPGYIEKLVKTLEQNKSDISICGFIGSGRCPSKAATLSRTEALSDLLTQRLGTGVMVWNKLYKRSLFKGLKFNDGRLHEDNFIMPRILERVKSVSVVPDKLYHYRENPSSITSKMTKKRLKDALDSIEDAKQFIKEKSLDKDLKPELAAYEYNQKFYLYKLSKEQSLKTFLKSHKKEILKNPYTSRSLKIHTLFMV